MPDDSRKTSRVLALFQPLRRILLTLILFSLVLNVLMLAPSLYMLQVYDRVLTIKINSRYWRLLSLF